MKLIGKGRTADVYLHDNKAIKVYHQDITEDWISYEYKVNQLASQFGGPKVYGYEKLEDKKGISFEYIDGVNLAEYLKKHPSRVRSIGKIMGGLHKEVHDATSEDFISQNDYFESQIRRNKYLDDLIKGRLLDHLKSLEGEKKLCHGDFHVENIMVSDRWRIIDWTNAYLGDPVSDFARTYMIMSSPTGTRRFSFYLSPLIRSLLKMLKRHYKRSYFKRSGRSKHLIRQWLVIQYAVRLNEDISEERAWLMSQMLFLMKKLGI